MLISISNADNDDIFKMINYFEITTREAGYNFSIVVENNCLVIKANEEFEFDNVSAMNYLEQIIHRLKINQSIEEAKESKGNKETPELNHKASIKRCYKIAKFNKEYFAVQVKINQQKKSLDEQARLIWNKIPDNIRMVWDKFEPPLKTHIVECITKINDPSNPVYLKMLNKRRSLDSQEICTISKRYPKIPVLVNDTLYDLTELLEAKEKIAYIHKIFKDPQLYTRVYTREFINIQNISLDKIKSASKVFLNLKEKESDLKAAEEILDWLKQEFNNTNSSGLKKIINEIDDIITNAEETTLLENINRIIKQTSENRINGLRGLTSLWSESHFFGSGRSAKAKNFYKFCAQVDNVFTDKINFQDNFKALQEATRREITTTETSNNPSSAPSSV